jgi:hypothetical protein
MVQIHSPRPFLLGPVIYRQTYKPLTPCVGPGGRRSKSNRPDHAIARTLIGLHFYCEVFCNTWNLSNLSNSLADDLTKGQGIRLFGDQAWT